MARPNWRRLWPRSVIGRVLLGAFLFGIVCVYLWNRIVSDVPVFAPAEWVWLEGDVELLVFPASEDLLIRRTRAATAQPEPPPVDDLSAPFVARRARERAELRRSEKSAIGMPAGVSRDAYCYRYDPRDRTIEPIDCKAWGVEVGQITRCGRGNLAPYLFEHGVQISQHDVIDRLTGVSRAGPRILGWRSYSSSVCRCPPKLEAPTDRVRRREVLRNCLVRQGRNGLCDPNSDVLAASVSALHDLQLSIGIPMWSGSGPTGSRRQHYHQILRIDEEASVGKPVRLAMVTNLGGGYAKPGRDMLIAMGWSADDRFVVYVGRTSFCVVHVEPGG